MADVVKTRDISQANIELRRVLEFNKGRKRGQYKYVYISRLKSGRFPYVVRLSQKKPTAKTARSITMIGR